MHFSLISIIEDVKSDIRSVDSERAVVGRDSSHKL